MRRADLAVVFRSSAYRRAYGAAALARLANDMVPVAVALHVLDRTGSTAVAGLTVGAITLPGILSAPILGAHLDRSSRPACWFAADQALTAAGLVAVAVAAGSVPTAVLLALAVAAGIATPLTAGGFSSVVPSLVPQQRLKAANTLDASSFNAAMIAGPALAAALAAGAGTLVAVLVQVALRIVALVLVLALDVPLRERPVAASVGDSVAAGLRHVARTPPLLGVTVAGFLALVGRGMLVLGFPFLATELGEGHSFAGWLWSAFAAGALAGAVLGSRIADRAAPTAVALFGTAGAGAFMLSWPLATAGVIAVALVAVAGLAYGPALAATITLRQVATPESLRGQVFMMGTSLKGAGFAVGSAVGGVAVVGLGAGGLLAFAGALHLGGAALGAVLASPLIGRRAFAFQSRTGARVPPAHRRLRR